MSVLVIIKFRGDTATFRQSLTDRAAEYRAIAERAQASGGVHHRFGVGDGYVVVNDEWESMEDFDKFFSDPQLQAFIGSAGADTSAPPEVIVAESVASPDQY